MTATVATPVEPSRSALTTRPAIAGIAYVGAWVVGLSAFGVGPGVGASDADVARYFDEHSVASALQSTSIHGVAAVALAGVLLSVRRTGALPRTAWIAGLAGAALSIVQWALGLWRSLAASGSTTVQLVDAIDRIDGAKMLAFAMMIGASVIALRSRGVIGGRLQAAGTIGTASLAVAGVAYGLSVTPLRVAAGPALLLLLAYVAGIGIAAGRRAA